MKHKLQDLRLEVRARWSRLTDEDLEQAGEQWERLSTLIQARYERTHLEVERELQVFRLAHDAEQPRP